MAAALYVRAIEADAPRARTLIAALATEGIAATLHLAPLPPRAESRVVYLHSSAAAADAPFQTERRDAVKLGIAIVVSYTTAWSPTRVRPDAVLEDWDGRDRVFAGFRDLVLACRRLLGVHRHATLSLDKLHWARWGASASSTASAAELTTVGTSHRRAADRQSEAARVRDAQVRDVRPQGVGAADTPDIGAAERATRLGWLEPRFPRNFEPRAQGTGSSERVVPRTFPTYTAPPAPPAPPPVPSAPAPRRRRLPIKSLVLAALGAGAVLYWWQDIVAAGATLLKALGAAAPPLPPETPAPAGDVVDVSVFAPEGGDAGAEVMVQVFLHAIDAAAAAKELAAQADPGATARGITTLAATIARDQRVDVALEATGLTIDEPVQHLVWRGQPRACQFLVTLPAASPARTCHVKVRVSVDGVPVGALRFTLKVGASSNTAVELRGDSARRYRHAFLSYASPDRAEVLKRAQGLKAAGLSFFQDVLSLEPGQRWERRLYEEIDRCDVFLLFWSSRAAASEWVIREAEYALARQSASQDAPDVTPVLLEGPPVPLPPDSLKAIHFNDALRYVIAGVEAEDRPS